jgi:hypothetical protein
MSSLKIMRITNEQMNQLVKMTKYFYATDKIHVYQDPDFLDNIVIALEKSNGYDYNSIGWYQVCYDLILPKIVDKKPNGLITGFATSDDVINSFVNETFSTMNGKHPVDLLYSLYVVISYAQNEC